MNTKLSLILLLILPIISMSQSAQEKKINELIDSWHRDAAAADMEAYFSKIADDGIYIGTDATEIWTKQEFYDWSKPQFDSGKGWDFTASQRNIYFSEDGIYAWFDELLDFSRGELRGSGVLKLTDDEWKIKHYVLSLPVPNDDFRKVIDAMEND